MLQFSVLCYLILSISSISSGHIIRRHQDDLGLGSGFCITSNTACSGNLVSEYNMTNMLGCSGRCSLEPHCTNWTWWGDTDRCQLFSDCKEEQKECVDCQTGLRSCGIWDQFVSAVSGGQDGRDKVFLVSNSGLCNTMLTMPRARWGHTSSFIHNKLILCGGTVGDTVRVAPSDTCDIYSLTSRGWKHGLKMETGRHSAAGIPVLGRMYVIGGQTQTGPTDSMEVYDPSHDTWTHGPQMPQAVSRPCAVVFRDVIILSGGSFTDKAGNTVETNQVLVFNVTSQTWTKTTPMKQARAGHGCSLNVRPTTHSEPIYEMIVTGGEFEDESLATAEVFTIQDKQWTDFPSLPFKLSDQVHIQSGQSRPGLLGGLLTGVASPLVLHLTEEDGWKLAEYALPKGLAGHSVTDFPREMVDC